MQDGISGRLSTDLQNIIFTLWLQNRLKEFKLTSHLTFDFTNSQYLLEATDC